MSDDRKSIVVAPTPGSLRTRRPHGPIAVLPATSRPTPVAPGRIEEAAKLLEPCLRGKQGGYQIRRIP